MKWNVERKYCTNEIAFIDLLCEKVNKKNKIFPRMQSEGSYLLRFLN